MSCHGEKRVIIVGEHLLDNYNIYPIRKSDKKGIIYSEPLVDEIVNALDIEFENKTSINYK